MLILPIAISTAFVAPSTFDLGHRDFSGASSSLTRTQWRLPAGISSAAVARPAGGRRAQRRFGREALAAKGVAGMVLLRFAYRSPLSAALAIVLSFVVAVAPVGSVEAVLLAGLLCLLGTASYWPANVLVYALSSAGAAGCLNGCLMWWEKRRQQSSQVKQARPTSRRSPQQEGGPALECAGHGARGRKRRAACTRHWCHPGCRFRRTRLMR